MSDERAPIAVTTRIVRVTTYEDRAEVVREATVTLPAGGAVLVVRELAAVISDEHVIARLDVVAAEGEAKAHVNDVRVDRRVLSGDDELAARRAAQRQNLEAIDEELRVASAEVQRIDDAIGATQHALQRWAQSASLATGRGHADAAAWKQGLTAFEKDLSSLMAERAKARATLEEVQRRRSRAADVRGPKPTGQRTVANLVLRVSASAAATFKLVVSTLVPCAAWRPTHEAWLLPATATATATATSDANAPHAHARRVRFTTYAAVWNRTGESWSDVELVLSTARPSAGAELPPLRPDRLTLRTKTAEERKSIVVEHREESVPRSATQGTAPGVDDGGQARTFRAQRVTIADDGRPHRVQVGVFEAPAIVERVAYPELVPQVFLRASLKNPGPAPILAGAVTLVVADDPRDGASTWVGTGDVLFIGSGEAFDLSFGSDDRFLVRTKKRRLEDKKLVGKDVVHFLREATLSQTGSTSERVIVHLRLPISEVKQLRVLPSPQHTTVSAEEAKPDDHGIVRVPVDLAPGVEKKIVLAFSFDASGDVRIPDPW